MEERGANDWSVIGDRALVDALRLGQVEAVDEFIRRFEPLVSRYAQLLRVPYVERRHWIGELLYEVAMTLSRGRAAPPLHLGAYVAGACNLKVRKQRVAEGVYRARVEAALEQVGEGRESAVIGLSSESALRAVHGPLWEPPPLSPLLSRLAKACQEEITEDERTLLEWLACQVSYTTIARWLGITRPAAVSRIQRLRVRLIRSALSFGAALTPRDRAEFVRFLKRTKAIDGEHILKLET